MFPSFKHPSVFWVGLNGDLEALQLLWKDMDERLTASGYPREPKFHPHITLGRFRSQDNVECLRASLQQIPSCEHLGGFAVTSFCLMESRLASSGPSYHTLSTHEFD